MDILGTLVKDPNIMAMLQGSGAALVLAMVKAASKDFDASGKADVYKPYLEKGLLVMTLLVAIAKAALEGNAAGAPWDQVVAAVMFFIGAKATGDKTVKKVVQETKLKLSR